jgi:tRNA-dihydrouridine synthase 2
VEHTSLPIIANGGSINNRNSAGNTHEGIKAFWRESGAASVMVARAAEWNPSVFRAGEKEEVMVVVDRYLRLAIHYDYPFNITKYCLQQLLGGLQDSELGRLFLACATLGDLAAWGGLGAEHQARRAELAALGADRTDIELNGRRSKESQENCRKRKLPDGEEVTEMFLPFVRGHFGGNESCRLPKTLLLVYSRRQQLEQPVYTVERVDKQFRATVRLGCPKQSYASMVLEKNKKYAEQGAALVAVRCLGIGDKSEGGSGKGGAVTDGEVSEDLLDSEHRNDDATRT